MRDDAIADRPGDALGQRRRAENRESRLRLRRRGIRQLLQLGRFGLPLHVPVIEQGRTLRKVGWRDLHRLELPRLEDPDETLRNAGDAEAGDQDGRQQDGDRRRGHGSPAWRVPIEPALVPAGGPCRFLSGDARLHHRKRGASLRFEGRNPQQCRRGARLIRDGIEPRFAVRAFVEVCLVRRRQRQRLVVDPTQRSVTQVSHDVPPCAEPLPPGAAAFPRFQP